MTPRRRRLVLAGLAAAVVAAAGTYAWREREEARAKEALAAEIRALRAARRWPEDRAPTREEIETANLYLRAGAALPGTPFDDDELAFFRALETAPWTAVAEAVADRLAKGAASLALLDAATAREECRFRDPSFSLLRYWRVTGLLEARGHAALASGDAAAAVEDARRLLRTAAQLSSIHVAPRTEETLPLWWIHLQVREQQAARLLAAVATAPELPGEVGPLLVAAARGPWGIPEVHRRIVDAAEDWSDAWQVRVLAPDGAAWLGAQQANAGALAALLAPPPAEPGLVERAREGWRRLRTALPEVPTAAEIREYRSLLEPRVAALRRRDREALAPLGPLDDEIGKGLELLSPRVFRHAVADEARVAVARAAATIRAFQLAEGRPPRHLDELAPAGHPEALLDPFDGKPLEYETSGDAWRVRSRAWKDPHAVGAEGIRDYPPPDVRFPRGE